METKIFKISGLFGLLIQILLLSYVGYWLYSHWSTELHLTDFLLPVFSFVIFIILFGGYLVVHIGESAILTLLGKYQGSLTENGWWFVNPFSGTTKISTMIDSHKTKKLKVNEKTGVPIEIAAMVNFQVTDTYKANFNVEDYNDYILNQVQISLRAYAGKHTYAQLSSDENEFIQELNSRISKAGATVIDAKVTHLAYASEIASSMLQKQSASALGEARQIIVDNAVNIAKSAAEEIQFRDTEQQAKFVSNLIVVLCSEKQVSPVITV